MDEMKLRPYDGTALAGFLMLPGLFYTDPGMMAEQSGSAAWITVLASYAVMLCVFLITTALMRRYEGKDIVGTASAVIGRPAGVLYGIALALYFCFSTGVFIREGAEIFKTYGLRLTPVYVIAGLILLAGVTMNFFGGRAIVKSAGFFFIIILLGIVFVALLGLNRYNPDYLFPVLDNGIPDIAKGVWHTSSMIDGAVILALFAPGFTNTAAMRRSGAAALAVSAALSVLFYLCFIMMFSPPVASKMISGFMEMGKSIYYNHFFYRFESALLFLLVFSSVITASLGLYIARKSAALAFGIERPKTLTVICAVLILIAAFIPANLLDLSNHYLAVIKRYGVFFVAGFPLLLFIISSVKRIFKYEKN